jgi:outer membrane protein
MKKYVIILFFVFALNSSFSNAENKIVFIDMEKVMTTSKAGSSILNQIEVRNKKALLEFNDNKKKLKELETQLISQKNILAKPEYEKKVIKLRSEIKKYQDQRKETIMKLNQLKVSNTNDFLQKINQLLVKFSDENSISLILQKNNIVTGKSELDISNEMIKIIDLNIQEFIIK